MTTKKFLQSRKFIVFLVSVVLYIINSILHHNKLPCVPEQYMPKLIMLVVAWIGAQGIADINFKTDDSSAKEEVAEAAEIAKDISGEVVKKDK